MFVMSGAVVCQAVSVRVVGEDHLKVIFRRSVCQIKNDVSAAEAAGGFPPKRGRGYPCKGSFHLVNPVMMADTQPLLQPFLPVVGLVLHPSLRLRARHGLSL